MNEEVVTITLRLKKSLAEKIRKEARKRYGKKKGAIRKYIEDVLEDRPEESLLKLVDEASCHIGPVTRDEMHDRD